jgi:hypothetical protein
LNAFRETSLPAELLFSFRLFHSAGHLDGNVAQRDLLHRFGGPSQVRAVSSLFSHRRILRFFFRCDLTASFLQHARKKIFVSNNTDKKNIVSDKCHKLCFYFLHGTRRLRQTDARRAILRRRIACLLTLGGGGEPQRTRARRRSDSANWLHLQLICRTTAGRQSGLGTRAESASAADP